MQTQPDTAVVASAAQLIADSSATLAAAGIDTARLDAEMLLATACDTDRTRLYAGLREPVPRRCADTFHSLLARRLAREPLAYIVGHQEFWSLDFIVAPDVLIPRPETELLVELAIEGFSEAKSTLCDLGTGSGCVAVSLAHELPHVEIWAVDISSAALTVARANAQHHAVAGRIRFTESDLFAAIVDQRFDTIVCNPPYVSTAELERPQPELRWEPRRALDGGREGLEAIERLVAQAREHLTDAGWFIMEIGATQGPAVQRLAQTAGFRCISVRNDHTGRPRVVVARR